MGNNKVSIKKVGGKQKGSKSSKDTILHGISLASAINEKRGLQKNKFKEPVYLIGMRRHIGTMMEICPIPVVVRSFSDFKGPMGVGDYVLYDITQFKSTSTYHAEVTDFWGGTVFDETCVQCPESKLVELNYYASGTLHEDAARLMCDIIQRFPKEINDRSIVIVKDIHDRLFIALEDVDDGEPNALDPIVIGVDFFFGGGCKMGISVVTAHNGIEAECRRYLPITEMYDKDHGLCRVLEYNIMRQMLYKVAVEGINIDDMSPC